LTAPVLLDASCVLAWAFTEPGADQIESVLPDAYITAVNLAEVIAKRDRLGPPGVTFAQDLVSAGLTVVPMGWPQTCQITTVLALEATKGGRRRLSLGDLCCLAYAIEQPMQVWTADRALADLDVPANVLVIRGA
jgi:PIN domain nuclease of toxin-antitoxin system